MRAIGEINLWLDDVRKPLVGFVWAKNYQEAIELMTNHRVNRCSLDHDLAWEHYHPAGGTLGIEKTGLDVVKWMRDNNCWPREIPQVHSLNPVGARRMAEIIAEHYGCDVSAIIRPFYL